MGHFFGIHGLLLRWLLEPEFLSQGFPKILHSILFRIWFIFSFFQAVIRGICRLDFRVNIWIWDRFYHLMILIPHLSILILFLFAFFEGISGQPRLPSTYLKINQNHFVDLPPPSILLWFLIRKFSGKSRLFFITHFFSKTKLYQNATSWPMPNMRFSENQRMVTFFLVANLDHDNLICYAFFRIFSGFQRKIWFQQFLESRHWLLRSGFDIGLHR